MNGGTYLSKTEYDYFEGYSRSYTPTQKEEELENRFAKLQGEYFEPMKKPYEFKSVKEYYDSLDFPGKNEAFDGCLNSFLIAIGWVILCAIVMPLLNWNSVNRILNISFICICFGIIPIVIWLLGIIIGSILQKSRRKKYGERIEFEKISTEEKERYRQEYLSKLETSYSSESGKILKEYAILKGYDKV